MWPIQVGARVVDAESRPQLVEVAVVVLAVEPVEAELARPLLAHPGRGPQAVLPVDQRASAEGRPGLDRHLAIGGRERPSAQVEVLIAPRLELVEVGLVEVAAGLDHADPLALSGQRSGDDSAAGARADDA